MEIYSNFAKIYNEIMEVPYDLWQEYIELIWKNYNFKPKTVLDLACGTGNMTKRLCDCGYDTIGVDISNDMLAVAKKKDTKSLYLCQDMIELELYGTVDAIVCLCDSINYILEHADLIKTFKLIKNYLNPGGIFIFDINSQHKYKNILSDNTFSQVHENYAYIWENMFYDNEQINEYALSLFIKESTTNTYKRHDELHLQKAYSQESIILALNKAGLNYIADFEELKFDKPNDNTERIFFVASKSILYSKRLSEK